MRQFMLLDLQKLHEAKAGASAGLRLSRWNDRYFESCAKLIYLAYANHVDGVINDQYRSRPGALKFLKNIILLPGCGQFLTARSFILHCPASAERTRRAAAIVSATKPAITTSCATKNGGSDCVGAIAFRAGTFWKSCATKTNTLR